MFSGEQQTEGTPGDNPPRGTCGYAIANQNLHMLGGAAYLFLINAYLIYASASIVLALLRTPYETQMTDQEWRTKSKKMVRNTIFIIIPIVVIAVLDLYN